MKSFALCLNGNICDEQYKMLVSWLCNKSDMITFNMPNYNKKIITKKNKRIFPDCELYDVHDLSKSDKYSIPSEKMTAIFRPVLNDIICSYLDVEYAGQLSIYESEIIVLKSTDLVKKFLLNANELYAWKHPYLPEDLCFYKKGKCIARVIAHEQYCFIFNIKKHFQKELAKYNIKFNIVYIKRPMLSLRRIERECHSVSVEFKN